MRAFPVMKLFALLFPTLLIAGGCAPALDRIPRQTKIVGFDFSEYSKKGFLITPGEYGEDYETIGLLTFSIYPEAKKVDVIHGTIVGLEPGWIPLETTANMLEKQWIMEVVNPSEVIELAYQQAIKRGADAITHFKIEYDKKEYLDGYRPLEITGVQVTGLLIKRK
jgi:hypothetical protein